MPRLSERRTSFGACSDLSGGGSAQSAGAVAPPFEFSFIAGNALNHREFYDPG